MISLISFLPIVCDYERVRAKLIKPPFWGARLKIQSKLIALWRWDNTRDQIRESSPVTLFLIYAATRFTLFMTCLEVSSILNPVFSSGWGNWLQTSLACEGFWLMNSLYRLFLSKVFVAKLSSSSRFFSTLLKFSAKLPPKLLVWKLFVWKLTV